MKFKSIFFLSLIFLISNFLQAEESSEPKRSLLDQTQFHQAYQRTLNTLISKGFQRPFKWAGMNDSLEKLAQAAELYKEMIETKKADEPDSVGLENTTDFLMTKIERLPDQDIEEKMNQISGLLQKAVFVYPENDFAFLMFGLLEEKRGDISKARFLYQQFLKFSSEFKEFDRHFMSASDYQKLRQTVLESFESREIKDSGYSFIYKLKNWFETNRHLILILVSFGLAAILFFKMIDFFNEHFGPLPKGYRRCPKCQKIILKVDLECFYCRKRLKSKQNRIRKSDDVRKVTLIELRN